MTKTHFDLGNGTMPAIGFGCWGLEKFIAEECVHTALR